MTVDVLIITGAPGSGKTTVAGDLAHLFERSVHVETDAFFQFVKAGFVDPWKAEAHRQNEVVFAAVGAAATAYAGARYFTILDGIVTPRRFFAPLTARLRAAGLSVAYAVLQVPLPVAIERAALRSRAPFRETDVIEGVWRQFSDLKSLRHHAIDSGKRSPANVAREIADTLLSSDRLHVTTEIRPEESVSLSGEQAQLATVSEDTK